MEQMSHQKRCVAWMKSRPRAIIAMEQGLGKTACAIIDAVYPVLVIVPAHAKLVWRDEFVTWAPDRKVQIVQTDGFFRDDVDVWILNYDVIGRTYLPDARTLICDESHYIANVEARRTKKIVQNAKVHPSRLRLLSGTPMQRPIDLFVPMSLCGATRLGWADFGRRYAAGFKDQWGKWNMRGSSHVDELAEKLAPVMFRITKDEALPDLPLKIWKVIALDLPVDIREREYSLEAIAATNSPTPFAGLSEILQLQSEIKLPLCISFIEDLLRSEEKVIVFAHHRETIKALHGHFTSSGIEARTYFGQTSDGDRPIAIERFQTGTARLFIGNHIAAGTAITLTAASAVVFVEGSWNPNVMDQCADRAHRIGQTRPVRCFVLTVDQSIDHQMVRRCLEKLRVIKTVIIPTVENLNMSETRKLDADLGHALVAFGTYLLSKTETVDTSPTTLYPAVPTPPSAPAVEKATRGRPPKAPPVAAPVGPTLDEVRMKVVAYINTGVDLPEKELCKGRIVAIIGKFGSQKLDQLPIAAYGAVLAEIEAIAKGSEPENSLDI